MIVERVIRVSRGWKNQTHGEPLLPIVDTYIEVLYGDRAHPEVAFVNDGRLFGSGSYLPNKKLLAALSSLVPPPHSSRTHRWRGWTGLPRPGWLIACQPLLGGC